MRIRAAKGVTRGTTWRAYPRSALDHIPKMHRTRGRGQAGDHRRHTALRLGHWFCNSAEFWLNLQSAYELRLAEQAAGSEIEALPVMPDSKATPQQPSML